MIRGTGGADRAGCAAGAGRADADGRTGSTEHEMAEAAMVEGTGSGAGHYQRPHQPHKKTLYSVHTCTLPPYEPGVVLIPATAQPK